MTDQVSQEIVELLRRIESNQREALAAQREAMAAQQEHLALARAQFERSERTINESVELQRVAVARQSQIRNVSLPLIGVLVVLFVWVLVRSRILF
jgi:hypothetical protein